MGEGGGGGGGRGVVRIILMILKGVNITFFESIRVHIQIPHLLKNCLPSCRFYAFASELSQVRKNMAAMFTSYSSVLARGFSSLYMSVCTLYTPV